MPGNDASTGNKDSSNSSPEGGKPSDSGPAEGGDSSVSCEKSTSKFTPVTYVPAVANQGVCDTATIAAFVAACGDKGSQTKCDTWQTTNVLGDAGAGTACGNCIFAPMNNGGTWTDPEGYFGPNYGGCIQLTDPTNGPACASALDNADGCVGVACDSCSSGDIDACRDAAAKASCSSYASTEQTACKKDDGDGGAFTTCSPGAGTSLDPDFTYIAGLICGGTDAG
jgi:hypothetical protein